MKRLILLMLLLMLTSCVTNYYSVIVTEDTKLYSDKFLNEPVITIPKDSEVFISDKKSKKKKITYGTYSGWAYKPSFRSSSYKPESKNSTSSYVPKSSSYSTPSSSAGKTVQVKGYTRKDGTYVKPHTRSAPRRKK